MPIGRKREFISAAAPIAAPSPPPAATIEIAANCAEPAKTIADMTIAPIAEKPASRASTPNDSATTLPASAYGTPARSPARKESRALGGELARSASSSVIARP